MKLRNVLTALMLLSALALFNIACEGPEGPAGTNGVDGADGGQECVTCHNMSSDLVQKIYAWKGSKHSLGTSFEYAGTRGSCANCHSQEGFRMVIAGEELTAPDYASPVGCRACHTIHTNFDMTDFAAITTEALALVGDLSDGMTFDLGKGNLCANCHQTRARGYDWTGTEMAISSSHWGPHYGAQANMLVGTGFYTFGQTLPSSAHGTMVTDGCVQCHMVNGNHTFEASLSSCTDACHTDAESFDYNGFQTEFNTLFAELEEKLVTAGLLAGDAEEGYHPVSGQTVPIDQAGALWNYRGLYPDGSHGVHNPKYMKALLEASIAVFD